MGHISASELRRHMTRYFDRVTQDHDPLVVTRQGDKEDIVLVSETAFQGWQNTAHPLSRPKNAVRQRRASQVPATDPWLAPVDPSV